MEIQSFFYAERHSNIHTYPEYHFIAMDLYYCDPNIESEPTIEILIIFEHEFQLYVLTI